MINYCKTHPAGDHARARHGDAERPLQDRRRVFRQPDRPRRSHRPVPRRQHAPRLRELEATRDRALRAGGVGRDRSHDRVDRRACGSGALAGGAGAVHRDPSAGAGAARFWSQIPTSSRSRWTRAAATSSRASPCSAPGSPQRTTPFSLRVNPACALDSAAWSSRTGRVDAFNGWDTPGPQNTANVDVVWTPRCVTQTTNYVFASSSQRVCSVEFALSAWAQCPVGIAP